MKYSYAFQTLMTILCCTMTRMSLAKSNDTNETTAETDRSTMPPTTSQANSVENPLLQPPPRQLFYWGNFTILRAGPVGMEVRNKFMYQRHLFESENPIIAKSFWSIGVETRLNPAFYQVGPRLEFQPMAAFRLNASIFYLSYSGRFGFLQTYSDPTASYDDETRLNDLDAAIRKSGIRAVVEPILMAKIGNVAFQGQWEFHYTSLGLDSVSLLARTVH